jgi:hypothetical protein
MVQKIKLIFVSLLILSGLNSFAQTQAELQAILATTAVDVIVNGAAAQSALNNNILLATAGTGAFDATSGGTITYHSAYIQIIATAGISAGAVSYEGSNDNTNFVTLPVYDESGVGQNSPGQGAVTIAASVIKYHSIKINYRYLRCRISTGFVGGTISAIVKYSALPYMPYTNTVASLSSGGFQATAIVGAYASSVPSDGHVSPSTSSIKTFPENYNGATWDMQRANWNTTTGDAGTKVSGFNGISQTNYNAKGAIITALCGTVSGTSPTMVLQLQWSPDAGTTWLNYGPATTAITATGNTATIIVYPNNSSTAGATPAALTIGSTTSVQINAVLPRTWRLIYTLGGTTPSFALTATYVNYIL